jgi:7-cyano-7-deazaguanine synthase
MSDSDPALVLFSGGQDSATCLAWACDRFKRVETVGFDYGQRHRVELDQRDGFRALLPPAMRGRLGDDHILRIPTFAELGGTALTDDVAIAMRADGLPNTFVPGRNLVFLTFAAALAQRRGLRHLVAGMCETDYSGYPDCRDDTLKALQVAINLGMNARLVLHTPLMWRDKAATWRLAETLGGAELVEAIRVQTLSCYNGDTVTMHAWGRGCGNCPACELRARGWNRHVAG